MIQSENAEKEKPLPSAEYLPWQSAASPLIEQEILPIVPRRVRAIVILLWFVLVILLLARLNRSIGNERFAGAKPAI